VTRTRIMSDRAQSFVPIATSNPGGDDIHPANVGPPPCSPLRKTPT
jgi:hypothetical protein